MKSAKTITRVDLAILSSLVLLGLACLAVDFFSLEKTISVRLTFPEIAASDLFEAKEALAKECEQARVSQGVFIQLDGIDCRNLQIADTEKLASDYAEKFEVFVSEQNVVGTAGSVMFLFSGIWFFLCGIFLSIKILKDE